MKWEDGKGISASGYGDGELNLVTPEGKFNNDLLEVFNAMKITDVDTEGWEYTSSLDTEDYLKKLHNGLYSIINKKGNEELYLVIDKRSYKLN